MKKNLRLTIVALAILALLLSTFPASAGTIRTEVTGTMDFLGEPEFDPDGWGMDVGKEILPGWFTNIQCRKDTQYNEITTEDGRIDGYNVAETNCFFHFDSTGDFIGAHLWSKSVIYANSSSTQPNWFCSGQGFLDSDWNFNFNVVCQGAGDYAGLLAKFNLTALDDDTYNLKGYILEPGG